MSDERTDAELVVAISGGNRDALGELYDRHASTVTAIAHRFRLSHEVAEDLVHDIFMELWARAYEYDPERGSVVTWLAVRARSRCVDHLRKTGRRAKILDRSAADLRPDESELGPVRRIEHQRLRTAVETLDADLLEVTRLAYFEGATTAEIADSLGVPQGTVKSRMRRAREALHAMMTEDE